MGDKDNKSENAPSGTQSNGTQNKGNANASS